MADIRKWEKAGAAIKTFDRGAVGIRKVRSAAAEVKRAENRLEEYGRSSKADGNQETGRLTGNPVKTIRLSEKAAGFIRSRQLVASRKVSSETGRINATDIREYREAGKKAYIRKQNLEGAASHVKTTFRSLLEKGGKAVKLSAVGSKAVLTAFAAAGGAGIACVVVIMIVTGTAVIFEMAGYDEDALSSDMSIEQFMETAFGDGNEDIVLTAEKELGNKGGKRFWKWYGFDSRVEWCACFVSWCADKSGLIQQGQVPKFADCRVGMNWFKKQNRWMKRGAAPKPGWIIFFDWGNDGSIDHVGIVERSDGSTVHTIEGNSRNMVRRKSYSIKSKIIEGYGVVRVEKVKEKSEKKQKDN